MAPPRGRFRKVVDQDQRIIAFLCTRAAFWTWGTREDLQKEWGLLDLLPQIHIDIVILDIFLCISICYKLVSASHILDVMNPTAALRLFVKRQRDVRTRNLSLSHKLGEGCYGNYGKVHLKEKQD